MRSTGRPRSSPQLDARLRELDTWEALGSGTDYA